MPNLVEIADPPKKSVSVYLLKCVVEIVYFLAACVLAFFIAFIIGAANRTSSMMPIGPDRIVWIACIMILMFIERIALWNGIFRYSGAWTSKGKRTAFLPMAVMVAMVWVISFTQANHYIAMWMHKEGASFGYLFASTIIIKFALGFGGAMTLVLYLAKYFGFKKFSAIINRSNK